MTKVENWLVVAVVMMIVVGWQPHDSRTVTAQKAVP